jgi:hypothetical protein
LFFIPYAADRQLGKLQTLPQPLSIPVHSIESVIVDNKSIRNSAQLVGSVAAWMDVVCKDARHYRFGFESLLECDKISKVIVQYVAPSRIQDVFAFVYGKSFQQHLRAQLGKLPADAEDPAFPGIHAGALPEGPVPLPPQYDGWRLFNPVAEYERMRLGPRFRLTRANVSYQLCPSYPALLAVPAEAVSDADYARIREFRTSGRVPALSWKNPYGEQTVWRSSQPRTGMMNARCAEDERLIAYIGAANTVNHLVRIYDARPRINAVGNALAGKGYESSTCYPGAALQFMGIDNIHKVRDSYKAVVQAVSTPKSDAQYLIDVAHSGWFVHLHKILRAVADMVTHVDAQGGSLLVHCSDGWDRTSQLTALCKLCLDPYYRTIRGFIVLVEHEWLSFGHMFHVRMGSQASPVFIQFLDCVHQLILQFPRHFEFTTEFVAQIAVHAFSCRFGTFLFNCERERRQAAFKNDTYEGNADTFPSEAPVPASPATQGLGPPAHEGGVHILAQETVSLWTYLLASPAAVAGLFTNAMYAPGGCGDPGDVDEPWPYATAAPELALPASLLAADNGLHKDTLEFPLARGSVLYPCADVRRLRLWDDFFLRHHRSDAHFCYTNACDDTQGNLFPGGATTTSLLPMAHIANQHLHWARSVAREATAALSLEHEARVRAEEELRQLKLLLQKQQGVEAVETTQAPASKPADKPVECSLEESPNKDSVDEPVEDSQESADPVEEALKEMEAQPETPEAIDQIDEAHSNSAPVDE